MAQAVVHLVVVPNGASVLPLLVGDDLPLNVHSAAP
jgi:hypothetical protein